MAEIVGFAVVGGGIAGASAAYELSAAAEVALLESESTSGYHTTGRSAALFTEMYESGLVRQLTMAGHDFLTEPPPGFSATPILSPLASLLIAREDQLARLEVKEQDVGGAIEIERVDAGEAIELCPVLRPEYVAGGIFEPGSSEIDVHALHQGFLGGARKRGALIYTDSPVTAMIRANATWRITAGSHTIEAAVVVNAAGAWCDAVAALAGAKPLGLQPYRRTAFTFDAPPLMTIDSWPMVISAGEDFYFKPERTQLMGSLAEETPMQPHDVQAEEIDVALAIQRIQRATTFDIRHVPHAWAGLRTFAPDRIPVVGYDTGIEGFFWLAGQGGFGIMTSPAMSRLATGLALGDGVPFDLAAGGLTAEDVSPRRFAS